MNFKKLNDYLKSHQAPFKEKSPGTFLEVGFSGAEFVYDDVEAPDC